MGISIVEHQGNLGREDRLVRGCVSLSLALMALFSLASGRVTLILLGFIALTVYFAVTASTGNDPLYSRLGMDTRAPLRRADPASGEQADASQATWVSTLLEP